MPISTSRSAPGISELLVNNIIAGRQRNIEHFRKTGEVDVKQITSNPRDEAFMEKLVKADHGQYPGREIRRYRKSLPR